MNSNIVLIGMMGSGKTTLGRAIGTHLHYEFMDTDAEIENRFNMPIPHIFEQYGESYFRTLESSVVESAAAYERTIIATGGGVVMVEQNMTVLRKHGFIIFLRCDPAILYTRTCTDNNRPMLQSTDGRLERIHALLAVREPLYVQYSDMILDSGILEVDEMVKIIGERIR